MQAAPLHGRAHMASTGSWRTLSWRAGARRPGRSWPHSGCVVWSGTNERRESMADNRGRDMEPWEAAMFSAALETLAITMYRDLYSDRPRPLQWALADEETKKRWRAEALEIMIDGAMLAKLTAPK